MSPHTIDDDDENAKNLAVIDGGGQLGSTRCPAAQRALDVLEKKCPDEARSRLADYGPIAKQETKKEGIQITMLRALRGVNKSIPPSLVGKVECRPQSPAIALAASAANP